ncbi:MAG: tetratricopeptide repeat protein, partial [Acidobacteria bacterium]|nr:tetratricopeptide repeat protein [Acidobacteriota bacterium]
MSSEGNSVLDSRSRPDLRWPVAMISLLIPFVFVPYIFDPFQLPKEVVFRIGALLILGGFLLGAFRIGSVRLAGTGATLPLLLLLFLALLSVFQAPYQAEAFAAARDGAFALVIYLLVASALPREDRLIPGSLGLAALLTSSAGLLQILAAPHFSLLPPTMGGALAGDVSTAAVFVALLLPILAGLTLPYRGWMCWIWGLGTGVSIAFVVLARSRAGWLAALVGLLSLMVLRFQRPASQGTRPGEASTAPGKLIAFASAVLAISAILWGIYGTGIHLSSNPPSFKTSELEGWKLREDAWRVTRSMALSHPLGAGAGNWRFVFSSEAGNASVRTGFSASRLPLEAGNEYLQVLAELGAAGLFLMLWAGFALIRLGFRVSRAGAGFPVTAGTASLLGLGASCFLSNPFREQPTLWVVAILAALVCNGESITGAPGSPFLQWEMEASRRKLLGRVAAFLFVALVSLTLWGSGRMLLASADMKVGQAACARGDFARGLPALLRASRANPASAAIRALAAGCALRAGRPNEAQRLIEASLKLNPVETSSWFILAEANKAQGRMIDAIAAAERAKRFWPRDEAVNLLLGDLHRQTGDTLGASVDYQAALSGNPSSVTAYLREGDVLLSRSQVVNAVAMLSRAVSMDPFSILALNKLGAAYARAGDFEGALNSYQSLLDLNGDDPDAMLGLAGALSGLQRYCEALPYL